MSDLVTQIVVLLVNGETTEQIAALFSPRHGLERALELIEEAQLNLAMAAKYNRAEMLGTAISRVNDLFCKAKAAGELKTALAAQKELAKLTKLYDAEVDLPVGPEKNVELDQIREHLEPLGLAPEGYPLAEHARIAAERIRSHAGA